MANEVKLEILTYGIRETKKDPDGKSYLPLHDIFGEDFYDAFQEYLENVSNDLEINEGQQMAIRLREKSLSISSKKRTIRGIFESGHYGYESEFENIKTKAKKKKQIDDVEKLPFYFLVFVPEKLNIGIIILQRFGINGIHTIFKSSLNNFIKIKFPNLTLDLKGFVSKELAKSFIQDGGIREIILTKYNLPSDKTDRLGLSEYQDDILSIEIRVKAKRTRWFKGLNSKIKKYVNDPNARFFDTKELRSIGFDGAHKVSVVSKFNGNRRTIDLSETGQIKPYYDIEADGELEKEKNGHPKFESIDSIANKMLTEFQDEIK